MLDGFSTEFCNFGQHRSRGPLFVAHFAITACRTLPLAFTCVARHGNNHVVKCASIRRRVLTWSAKRFVRQTSSPSQSRPCRPRLQHAMWPPGLMWVGCQPLWSCHPCNGGCHPPLNGGAVGELRNCWGENSVPLTEHRHFCMSLRVQELTG